MGVRGIRLREEDEVVDMVIGDDNTEIITITNRGYGKRSKMKLYRKIKRGGKGVINIKFRHDDDHVKAVNTASDEDILIVTTSGMIIRVPSISLRTLSRSAKGVRVINLNDGDFVSSVALCDPSCDEDEETTNKIDNSEKVENHEKQTEDEETTKKIDNSEKIENHEKQTEE
jgi:DNA gyrase subunit A